MQRYFLEENYEEGQTQVTVTGDVLHHVTHVLRMTCGVKVYLIFKGEESFKAELARIDKNSVNFKLLEKEAQHRELPVKVTIAQAFPKGDKLDWVAQKGSELGMDSLLSFPADFSNVKWDELKREKKQNRLLKIAQAAAEQSQRTHRPSVELLAGKQELLNKFSEYDLVLVAYEEEAKRGETSKFAQILTNLNGNEKILAIFGPEGGISLSEVKIFKEHGAIFLGLGRRIMRLETAPLYFLSAVSYERELRVNIF